MSYSFVVGLFCCKRMGDKCRDHCDENISCL